MLHDLKRERRCGRIGVRLAGHVAHAFAQTGVSERDGRIAAVEQRIDRCALRQPRDGAVLPEDRRGVGQRALEPVVAAHQRAVAQVEPLVENLPESIKILVSRKTDIRKIDGYNALIKASVVFGFISFRVNIGG